MWYIHQIQAVHQFVPAVLAYSLVAFQEPLSSLHHQPYNFLKKKKIKLPCIWKIQDHKHCSKMFSPISLLILWNNFETWRGCNWLPSLYFFLLSLLILQPHRQCFFLYLHCPQEESNVVWMKEVGWKLMAESAVKGVTGENHNQAWWLLHCCCGLPLLDLRSLNGGDVIIEDAQLQGLISVLPWVWSGCI